MEVVELDLEHEIVGQYHQLKGHELANTRRE